MAANAELLQKLQRQRLRMGEEPGAASPERTAPTYVPALAAQRSPCSSPRSSRSPSSRMQQREAISLGSPASSGGCEGLSQLQLKLKRQRRRMGELGSPLQEIGNHEFQVQGGSRPSVEIDGDVKVRQRALVFQTSENSASSPARVIGRVNIDRWESRSREAHAQDSQQKSSKEEMQEEEERQESEPDRQDEQRADALEIQRWHEAEELQRQEEEAELQRQEEKAELQRQQEIAELRRQEEESELQRQEEEVAEMRRQQEEAELRRQEEEAELQRQEDAELQRQQEEEELRRQQEEEELRRREEEAELQRQQEEEELRRQQEEAELQRQQEEEELRRQEEEAELRRQEEEVELQRQQEEAEQEELHRQQQEALLRQKELELQRQLEEAKLLRNQAQEELQKQLDREEEEAELERQEREAVELGKRHEAKLSAWQLQVDEEELPLWRRLKPKPREDELQQVQESETPGTVPSHSSEGFKWSNLVPLEEQDSDAEKSPCEDEVETPHASLVRSGREQEHLDTEKEEKQAGGTQCFNLNDGEDERLVAGCDGPWDKLKISDDYSEEPLEFFLLDCFAGLPQGVAEKLQNCLKVHEELVRRLCKRNDLLRAQVQKLYCDPPGGSVKAGSLAAAPTPERARPSTPKRSIQQPRRAGPRSCPGSPKSPGSPALSTTSSIGRTIAAASAAAAEANRRRIVRAEMAAKVDAMHAERARHRDEQHEAHLRARLDYTEKTAKERVLAMRRRAEREEEQIKLRFEAAMQTREGLTRSIQAVYREQEAAKAQMAELEEAIGAADARWKARAKDRELESEKLSALRNELKAHRARATKCQQKERRMQDLRKEIEVLAKTYPSAHSNGTSFHSMAARALGL